MCRRLSAGELYGPLTWDGRAAEVVQTLRTPVIYIEGGPKDIAYGTFNEPSGGAAASVAVSWLNWQLRGDAQSAKRFVGDVGDLAEQ